MGIKDFFKRNCFNLKWTCNVCGKENFNGDFFCDDCKNHLPINNGSICNHCGRKTEFPVAYCDTCKNHLTSLDGCRSAFIYDSPISEMIKSMKYFGKRYLAEVFAPYIANEYVNSGYKVDYLAYVPMLKMAELKRGYNQSKCLSKEVSKLIGVEILDKAVIKKKKSKRQAKLTKKDRFSNLEGTFKVDRRKEIAGKNILIIDDVTTTGATAETIAKLLKKAKAKGVYLITVASVPEKATR